MKYIIIVLDNNPPIFEDILFQLKYSFDKKKIENEYLRYDEALQKNLLFNNENHKCVFFGTKCRNFNIPNDSIIIDLEQDELFEKHFTKEIVDKQTIMCYSRYTINKIKSLYSDARVGMFRFGYSEHHDIRENVNRDIDIFFVGSITDRREKIFNELKQKYKCVIYTHGMFGKQRQQLYNRSKIILSMASSEYMRNFTNASRIFPAVSTKGFVVAERCLDEEQHNILSNVCINVNYENLIHIVKYYLTFGDQREKMREKFYENIKSMDAQIVLD